MGRRSMPGSAWVPVVITLIYTGLFVMEIAAAVRTSSPAMEAVGRAYPREGAHLVGGENLSRVKQSSSSTWAMFKQCDSRWAKEELGTCNDITICRAGCAMSSTAMILYTRGVSTDPGLLNTWLKNNSGYVSGCDIVWSRVDLLGVTKFQGIEKATYEELCAGLKENHGIVANVEHGRHWVLLTGCLGNNTLSVNDPYWPRTNYTYSDIVEEAVFH